MAGLCSIEIQPRDSPISLRKQASDLSQAPMNWGWHYNIEGRFCEQHGLREQEVQKQTGVSRHALPFSERISTWVQTLLHRPTQPAGM